MNKNNTLTTEPRQPDEKTEFNNTPLGRFLTELCQARASTEAVKYAEEDSEAELLDEGAIVAFDFAIEKGTTIYKTTLEK